MIVLDGTRRLPKQRAPLTVGWAVPATGPLTVGWSFPATGPVRTAWEYRSLQTDGAVVTAVDGDGSAPLATARTPIGSALAILGADEWELVATHETPDGPVYLFKRPRKGGE
jgi:hypothetical protein